jgi:flavine halogenase
MYVPTFPLATLAPLISCTDTDFVALGASNNAWNVVRSEFDSLLLAHAAESGARVFTETRVDTLQFTSSTHSTPSASDPTSTNNTDTSRCRSGSGVDLNAPLGRPVRANYITAAGVRGEIAFDYLVDASGRHGLLSTKYLKNRRFNQSLRNVAVWGYWRGAGTYGVGTPREGAPFFEALNGAYFNAV